MEQSSKSGAVRGSPLALLSRQLKVIVTRTENYYSGHIHNEKKNLLNTEE